MLTPGDAPDVLVAMNPAALKANLGDVPRGATIIVNTDEFTTRNLAKVGYTTSPVDDGSLDSFHVHPVALTSITVEALADFPGLTRKEKERAKNMFALGLLSWMYTRPTTGTEDFLTSKFGARPDILAANLAALRAGWNYGETTEDFASSYVVAPAKMPPGTYRNITGNTALALGLVAAAHRAGLPLVLGSYPITPASDILHALAALKRHGVTTMQAEDEIAGIGIALGASFGGAIGVTTTSGPGVALKSESIGLAVSLELPAGHRRRAARRPLHRPAHQDRAGRPAPGDVRPQRRVPGADRGPADARRLLPRRDGCRAHRHDVPHPRLPALRRLPRQRLRAVERPGRRRAARPARRVRQRAQRHRPQGRADLPPVPARRGDPRPARGPSPAPPGLEHRIGGIEKADVTGNISYDPDNHDKMTRLRQAKVDGIVVPDLEVDDPSGEARVLVLGWGSTYGPIAAATRVVRNAGHAVARAHLTNLNPFPNNLGKLLRDYDRVVLPEMNLGQLAMLLRAEFLVDVRSHTSVRGLPFSTVELADVISTTLEELS